MYLNTTIAVRVAQQFPQKAGNSNEGELVVCRTKMQVRWY